MKKQKMPMTIVNPHAAGIDVGSRSHYVASHRARTTRCKILRSVC
ncbi:MAG: hypothetical protein RIA69_03390 [Cyclobacteriaceae bacterium]